MVEAIVVFDGIGVHGKKWWNTVEYSVNKE